MKRKKSSIKDLNFKLEGTDTSPDGIRKSIFKFTTPSVIKDELDGKSFNEVFAKVVAVVKDINKRLYIPKNPDGSYTWTKELENKLSEREIEYMRLSHYFAAFARGGKALDNKANPE